MGAAVGWSDHVVGFGRWLVASVLGAAWASCAAALWVALEDASAHWGWEALAGSGLPCHGVCLFEGETMDRGRASTLATVAFIVALAAGVGAGAYWGWWHGMQTGDGYDDPVLALPWIGLAVLSGVCLIVAVVVEVVLFLTPKE